MRRRLRTPAARAIVAAATCAVGVLMFVSVAMAEAGDGISATGASVDKVGWWSANNTATATPAGAITVPPPPGVPAGTLAVGAFNGAPDKITAIGILPDAMPGDTISSFTLTIKEAGPPAGGYNGSAAEIIACPITEFWVGGENGTWATRPIYDCEASSVAGERALDGTWTFDLLPIGRLWLDPNGTIAADGVVLVEQVDSPVAFQTVFATSGDGAIVVTIASESATTIDTGGSTDGGSGSIGGDGFEGPSFGSGDIPVGGLPPPQVDTPTPGDTPQDAPVVPPRTIAQSSPNILGNLPGGLVLAVPLFLVLLGLLAYSLGPAGEPAAAARQRGVSRALAARARPDHLATPSSLVESS